MRIVTQGGHFGPSDNENILLRHSPDGAFRLETKVAYSPEANYNQAGLILYVDDSNHAILHRHFSVYQLVAFQGVDNGSLVINADTPCTDTLVFLRFDVHDSLVTGYWSSDSMNWIPVGQAVFPWLSRANVKIGLFADNGGEAGYSAPELPADFDYFRIEAIYDSLNISSPNGGEEWQFLQEESVQWTGGNPGALIRVELNRDYPIDIWEILIDSTANDGEELVIPSDPLSDNCRIRVSIIGDTDFDISDVDFSITTTSGYLALIDPDFPDVPIISWNSGIVDCGLSTTDTLKLKNFGSQSIVVFPPAIESGVDFLVPGDCTELFAMAADEISACDVIIDFSPTQDGMLYDTILVQSNAVNIDGSGNVRFPVMGEQITTPAPPEVVLTTEGSNVRLSWNPVEESLGACPITVTHYLVFYTPDSEDDFYFHGTTPDTTYVHTSVIAYATGQYYQVQATTAPLPLLQTLPDEPSAMTREQVLERLNR